MKKLKLKQFFSNVANIFAKIINIPILIPLI